MNKKRRAKIEAITTQLEDIQQAIEVLKEEEEAYMEGIPETMTSKLSWAQVAVDSLEEAADLAYQAGSSLVSALMGED